MTAADPVWLDAPGLAHLPISGHPHAGDATVLNGRPHEELCLGVIAGRQLVIEAESLEYLDELGYALSVARARLAMYLPAPVHPFGDGGEAA
jgi:hypothetical protein